MKTTRQALHISNAAVAWLSVCVACGGGGLPPETPSDISPSLSASAGPSATASEPAPSSDLLAGIKAFDAGNYAAARTSFEAAAKKAPNNYEALLNLGLACEKLSDKAAAEAAYKSALAAKPDLDSAAANLCALYVDEGRIDDALTVAKAGLAKHPGSAPLHENLGTALAARGDRDEAIKELDQAVQVTPSDPMLQLTLAHWLNVWHMPGAASHLGTALGLAKSDYAMIASIGYEYRMAGEFALCIETFDRAVAIKDGGEVRTERALCHHGQKDDKAAMEDLEGAVASEPTYAPAHFYLGGRLATTKQFKKAAAEYATYLQLEPNGSLAKPAAERMKVSQDAAAKERGTKKK
jgi:tetratricopeptide (TPR) repeat protein